MQEKTMFYVDEESTYGKTAVFLLLLAAQRRLMKNEMKNRLCSGVTDENLSHITSPYQEKNVH